MSILDINIPVNYYFEEISKIPRGSYNEQKIADYVENFAKEHNLRYVRDQINNLIIYKDASAGYEDHEAIMLQAHMDMVNEKNKDSDHDFDNDPLDLYIDDGFITAKGTTLGADDGYGVAYMLALLSTDNVKHPPLECVFTVCEEVGLDGALAFDGNLISANRMIGLDSETEGETCTTSSGGCDVMVDKDLHFVDNTKPIYELMIKGLQGGHSGREISNGRGNANKLATRVMYGFIKEKLDIQLIDIEGGLKNNAIPRECTIIFASESDFNELKKVADTYQSYFKEEFEFSDSGVLAELKAVSKSLPQALSNVESKEVIEMMNVLKNGFVERSFAIKDLTVISLNMGVVRIENNQLKINYLLRSPMKSAVENMCDELNIVARAFNASTVSSNYYPGWLYDPDSKLRDQFKEFCLKHTGKQLKEVASHGGLETGIFKGKKPNLDIITMGPDMSDIHTPDERMNIASFVNCYQLLCDFIATL